MVQRAGRLIDPAGAGTSELAWRDEIERRDVPRLVPGRPGRVVVIAPHPDDEILGAGGLLRDLVAAGWAPAVVAVTDGEAAFGPADAALAEIRVAEVADALRCLGVHRLVDVRRLAIADGAVSASVARLEAELLPMLRDAALCLAPWPADGHPDHEAVGRAAAAAASGAGVTVLYYPVWLWHWAAPDALPWRDATRWPLDARTRRAKSQALQAFRSQLDGRRGPPILTAAVLEHFLRADEVFLRRVPVASAA